MATTTQKDERDNLLDELEDSAGGGGDDSIDLLDELWDDEGDARPWIPSQDGDVIQGKTTSVSTVADNYGSEVPLLEIQANKVIVDGEEADSGLWSVRGYGKAFCGKLTKLDPQYGETIAIRYCGMKIGKTSGNDYKDYKIILVRKDNTKVRA